MRKNFQSEKFIKSLVYPQAVISMDEIAWLILVIASNILTLAVTAFISRKLQLYNWIKELINTFSEVLEDDKITPDELLRLTTLFGKFLALFSINKTKEESPILVKAAEEAATYREDIASDMKEF